MSPRTIARDAVRRGLSLIALTDHNTARNVPAFHAAVTAAGIAAVYGCEVSTAEEAHVLAIFGDPDAAVEFGDLVYDSLPADTRDPERFGDQVVVDESERIVDTLESFLIAASAYPLHEIGRLIHERDGLFIPAHVDRSSFSIWSQLGFLPPDDYDALEMIRPTDHSTIDPGSTPVITDSDAHLPDDIGRRSFAFEGATSSFRSLRDALVSGRITLLS